MRINIKQILILFMLIILSCSEDNDDCCVNPDVPMLVVKFKFDPNQIRLNNLGQPASISNGNAAQSPNFRKMSANYIEFAPSATTALGTGEIIYEGPETNAGGSMAIDFQNAQFSGNNEVFVEIPLSQVASGTYQWVRVSLAYQEGEIDVKVGANEITGILGSFVGYNSYITTLDLNGSDIVLNENKLQGFWAFEALGQTFQGQAPAGATTVPNPLFDSSPIPQGSCVVTGEFENGFTISGNETANIEVTLSFSVNQSFEWTEVDFDGKYEPGIGEQVVDMGLRGLIPIVSN